MITIGGQDADSYLSSVEIFDLVTKQQFSLPDLVQGRAHHSCTVVAGSIVGEKWMLPDSIICAGGISMGFTYTNVQNSIEILDVIDLLGGNLRWKIADVPLKQVCAKMCFTLNM